MPKVLHDAREIEFSSLFNNKSIYLIPNYQRPYSWEDKQIDDFLSDIDDAFNKNLEAYLFGNIYLAKVEKCEDLKRFLSDNIFNMFSNDFCDNGNIKILNNDLDKITTYLIIDGQQRLTTFSIFYKLLGLDNLKIKLRNGNNLPKMILGEIDNNFYQKFIINNQPISEEDITSLSHERLKKAYLKIRKFLIEKNYIDNDDFKIFVKNKLNIIRSEITDMKYSVILFVSQTDRGKELNYIERLKSLLQFYVYIKLPNMDVNFTKDIDNLFVKLLNIMDKSIKNKIFASEDNFEEYFFKILSILLFLDERTNFRELARYNPKDAYRNIYNKLKDAYKKESEEINELLKDITLNIEKIVNLLEYINKNISNKEFKRIFIHLKPNFRLYAILANIYYKFPNENFVEKKYIWRAGFVVNQRLEEELNRLDIKVREIKDIFNELNINMQKGNRNAIKNFLKGRINKIKDFISSSNENLVKEINNNFNIKISILDFIEVFELAVWKQSKEPIEKFRNSWIKSFSKQSKLDLQGILDSFINFVELYRYEYIGNDKNFRYIFIEYERLINENESIWEYIEERRLEEEHIFPKELDSSTEHNLKILGFNSTDDYKQFKEKMGNKTLLERRLNASIGNNPIFDKAVSYKNFCNNNETKIKDICKLGEDLYKLIQYSNNQLNPSFRWYLELRDIELKVFAYKRFPLSISVKQ